MQTIHVMQLGQILMLDKLKLIAEVELLHW